MIKTGFEIFCQKNLGKKIKSRARNKLLMTSRTRKSGQTRIQTTILFKLNHRIFFLLKENIPNRN
jgi:hypothetical protein